MFKTLQEYFEKVHNAIIKLVKNLKQVCPKCGHKTLVIWGEFLDRWKCFHPDCGWSGSLNIINYGYDYSVKLCERFFEVAHANLLEIDEKGENGRAYNYLKDDRNINEIVIRNSDLGSIPYDFEYDIEKETQDIFDDLFRDITKEENPEKKTVLQNNYVKLAKLRDSLKSLQKHNGKWLAFFYRDKDGRITQIRTRKPYIDMKTFTTTKIRSNNGVFNFNLFLPPDSKSKYKLKHEGHLIAFEGEVNQLAFASICYENNFPVLSIALGSATTADLETMCSMHLGRITMFYDNDDAGKELLKKAIEKRSIYATTTPEPSNDIDDFIKTFKSKGKECLKSIIELIENADLFLRDLAAIKKEVTTIMKYDKSVNLEKCQKVAKIVINELEERGTFFKDDNYAYIFLKDIRRVVPLTDNNEQVITLLNLMGVNCAKDYYRYVMEEVRTYCYTHGQKITTHNYRYYDYKKHALYLFDNDTTVYKITPNNIETLQNGDEGIMFNYKPGDESFEIVEFNPNINYFDTYIANYMNIDTSTGNLTIKEYKILIFLWFLSTFFDSIMQSKVILTAIGEKGSGKTSTLRRIGTILFGKNYNVTPLPNKPEDFDTLVTNNHIVILDNIDSSKSWLNDKLASVSTGQTIQKRKLYTDNDNIKIPTETFIALNSRTPQFTRDDVADRLICIPFSRIKSGFIRESDLINNVLEHRNEIMTWLIFELQKVLKALETTEDKEYKTEFRIADFAVFGLKIFENVGKKEEFEKILSKVCQVQKEFAVEEDSLVYALKILAKKQTEQIQYTGFELYKALSTLAREDMFDIPEFKYRYKNVKSLTRRIHNIKNNITNDVIIEILPARSNGKLYMVKLADKEFRLPKTENDLFNDVEAKTKALEQHNDKGGKHDNK